MKRGYLIDHRILFFLGYLFYFSSPYIVGVSRSFEGYPGVALYQGYFDQIPASQLTQYLLITLSWLPSFYLGDFCFTLIRPRRKPLMKFPITTLSACTGYFTSALFFVFILFVFVSRGSLFGGYDSYDEGARGKMSSLLILYNFFLVYQLVTRQRLSLSIVIGVALTAFALLTMGGRMYVIQTFLITLIYKTSYSTRRWRPIHILSFLLLAFFMASFVGVWRLHAGFSLERAEYTLLAEPVFTWFSTCTYLISNEIPLFNFPANFLTSFFNLVPNTIISLKPFIVPIGRMAIGYKTPLGADSVWTTIVINFGSIGSIIFLFLNGFFLSFLKSMSERKRFWAVYYILVCGIIPFQFFRDAPYLINKQLFFNFLLLPGIILFTIKTYILIADNWRMGKERPNKLSTTSS